MVYIRNFGGITREFARARYYVNLVSPNGKNPLSFPADKVNIIGLMISVFNPPDTPAGVS